MVGQVIAIALLPFTSNLLLLTALSVAYGLWRGISLVANTLGMAESSDHAVVSRGASSGLFNAASDVGILLGPLLAAATAGIIGIPARLVLMTLSALVIPAAGLALNARRLQPAARVAD